MREAVDEHVEIRERDVEKEVERESVCVTKSEYTTLNHLVLIQREMYDDDRDHPSDLLKTKPGSDGRYYVRTCFIAL